MNRYIMRAVFTLAIVSPLFSPVAMPRDPVATDLHTAPTSRAGQQSRPFLREVKLSRLNMDSIQEEITRLQAWRLKHLAQAVVGSAAMVGAITGVTMLAKKYGNSGMKKASTEEYNGWKMSRGNWNDPLNILIGSLIVGVVGVTVTSFQRVFKLLAATTEEVLISVFRGYKGWFAQEEELLQGTLLELRESLHRARNNQVGREGSLYGINEQVTYYRSDVISQYEYVIWRFQNLIALMYLMAPTRNKALLGKEVQEMISYSETFAAQLEKDCNNNTHGFWTKYSADTLMMFHAMTECMKEFVTRFKVKLCR